jgi:NTE family protein
LRDGQLRSNSGDKELRQIRVHRIVLEDESIIGDARSRMKIDYDFFDRLHGIGQDAVRQFLASHFDDVGLRSTVDLSSEERVAPAA